MVKATLLMDWPAFSPSIQNSKRMTAITHKTNIQVQYIPVGQSCSEISHNNPPHQLLLASLFINASSTIYCWNYSWVSISHKIRIWAQDAWTIMVVSKLRKLFLHVELLLLPQSTDIISSPSLTTPVIKLSAAMMVEECQSVIVVGIIICRYHQHGTGEIYCNNEVNGGSWGWREVIGKRCNCVIKWGTCSIIFVACSLREKIMRSNGLWRHTSKTWDNHVYFMKSRNNRSKGCTLVDHQRSSE